MKVQSRVSKGGVGGNKGEGEGAKSYQITKSLSGESWLWTS